MKILVTGAKGFLGQNLIAQLENIKTGKLKGYEELASLEIYAFDKDNNIKDLELFCSDADFVFHLAGVNRPKDEAEFMQGNCQLTDTLLNALKKNSNKAPIMISSSIQASLDNPYGASKKAGENLIFEYAKTQKVKSLVYRFENIFGKWSRPNYNSAIATFCHNIARELDIRVNDENAPLKLIYIDDVVDELIQALLGKENRQGDFCYVRKVYHKKLGEVVGLIKSFKESRKDLSLPNFSDEFSSKLYSTYTSYLPTENFAYKLDMHEDQRGSFTEIIKTLAFGQFSVNISKPSITKGNHWHNSKNEKFLVVAGKGVVRLRDMRAKNAPIIEYFLNSDNLEVVDIPTGYTHNIENLSQSENLVTFMWTNECFNPLKPDTYFEEL